MADFLEIADEHRTETKSSISQSRDTKISLTTGKGQFLPLVFDYLDYIDCNRVKSHPTTISLINELDYEYPVKECTYFTDKYVYTDEQGEELRELPEWFGAGFYRKYIDRNVIVNFDNEAFGTRNRQTLQTGLHYVRATDSLD